MAHNANQTIIKSSGDVYVADVNTSPPVAADLSDGEALELAGWDQLGFIHEDGPQFQGFEGEQQVFNVWNVQAPARTRTELGEPNVLVPFVQWNTNILGLYFPGASVDGGTGDVVIGSSAGSSEEQALLVVFADGSNYRGFWVARTSANPGGDLTLPDDDFAQLPVRFDILSNTVDPTNMYRWIGMPDADDES